jgi:GNAT superfamily N-acetyltransferase
LRVRTISTRALVCTALAASLSPLGTVPSASAAGTLPDHICHFAWWRGDREVKETIRCAAHRWEVQGGARKALHVADCESGFDPSARGHGYGGVYQHLVSAWPDRAATFGFPDASVFNGRANSIVAVRMAHRASWKPWGNCA